MKRFPLYIYIIGVLLAMVSSCDDYDSWTADHRAYFSFSQDTVCFDTLITSVSSSTQRLMIYNHNNNGLRIGEVFLKHADRSHFRVNVDGHYLENGRGMDFEVVANDSMFVFVEVTLPETNVDDITKYTDSLCFRLESGNLQYVTLLANGQNAIHWHGIKVIDEDLTVESKRPIVIYDSIFVANGITLTLSPGTQFMFHQHASMCVNGTLHVNGTLEQPVVFRGDRTGNLFDYLPYDNTPQQWGGIYLNGHNHKLSHLDLHSSTFGIVAEDTDIEIENSVIHNTGGNALLSRNSVITAYNTQISNSYGNLFQMVGGSVEMAFCTFAQFYNYDATRGFALSLSDYIVEYGDTLYYEVKKADFNNCLITGYGEDVIHGSFLKESKYQDSVPYNFTCCYLKTAFSETDSVRFVNNVFEDLSDTTSYERRFLQFDTYARLYDFTPDVSAPFCDRGDMDMADKYPYDRMGRSRIADGRPDIGAYENVSRLNTDIKP